MQKRVENKKGKTTDDRKVAGQPPTAEPQRSAPPVRRSTIPLLLIVLLLVAAAVTIWWWREHQSGADESLLTLQGNVDVREVNLAFKVAGRIQALNVDEGDAVKAAQLVASLDKRYFDDDLGQIRAQQQNAAANLARLEHGSRPEEIAQAKARLNEANATQSRAHQDFKRYDSLVGQGAVSQQNYDQAKAALAEADAEVKYAQETLHLEEIGPRIEDIDAGRATLAAAKAATVQAERRLQDADLFAPSDGVILTRTREKGAIVAAGETVFTLTLNSPVWVRTYVNERDLGRIREGLRGDVRTDSAPGKVYHGRIGFISPKAEFTPKTVETRELRTDLVYRLRVIVDNPDAGLRQGMPVTATFRLDEPKK
jgi:HlyD family secretion protein